MVLIEDQHMTTVRYRHDPQHPARLNKNGKPEPTRQPRHNNRLYCLVWADHDLFKVGLGSGRNLRQPSAIKQLSKYLAHENAAPGAHAEWRADLPALEGEAWGDCQRLEMAFASAIKRRLHSAAASAVGLEWQHRAHLELVDWKDELTDAASEALRTEGLGDGVEWAAHDPRRKKAPVAGASVVSRKQQPNGSQLDSHRTRRNKVRNCAVKKCPDALADPPVQRDKFLYCSGRHAAEDALARQRERDPELFDGSVPPGLA